jgi:hypothetical protein
MIIIITIYLGRLSPDFYHVKFQVEFNYWPLCTQETSSAHQVIKTDEFWYNQKGNYNLSVFRTSDFTMDKNQSLSVTSDTDSLILHSLTMIVHAVYNDSQIIIQGPYHKQKITQRV